MNGIDAARTVLALAMLAGATVLDVRTRRVPNRYWFPFLAAAAVLIAADVALAAADQQRQILVALGVATALCGLFWLLWRTGMLFGGADAKALMVLALLEPNLLSPDLPIPPVLGTLLLASLAVLAVPIGLLAWNLAHGHAKLPAALLGVPMDLEAARASKVWPMQEVRPDGTVRFRYWVRLRGDFDARYAALEAAGLRVVWTTPKLPFFVPLMIGAVAWLWIGTMPLPAALRP